MRSNRSTSSSTTSTFIGVSVLLLGLRNDAQVRFRGRDTSDSRQRKPEARTATAAALDAHLSVVGFDNGFDDGQSKTDAILATTGRRRSAVVRFEQALRVFGAHARATICDENVHHAVPHGDGHVDR